MAVQCANCGEPLLGSVNRCWRCGAALPAHAGPSDIPPVRRPPIAGPFEEPLEASLVDQADMPPAAATAVRRGSPFAAGHRAARSFIPLAPTNPVQPALQSATSTARQMASAASIVLALSALSLSLSFPLGALLIALAGLGFAVWGLPLRTRQLAITALVLACMALAVSAFLAALDLHRILTT